MKAKELMIDDWVLACGKKTQVVWTGNVKKLAVRGFLSEFFEDEISPISITPEILEKNGFYFGYTSSVEDMINNAPHDIPIEFPKKTWCYDEGDGEITIDFPNQEDGGSITIAYRDKYMQLIFDNEIFVHELQHALNLCGINKNIIV